ncbi:MAG: hypothetical protein HY736_12635 [Verrucomicrobia bacterium]|nr:hypothetical protein [Verrucomicrobiota bacterium]
MLTRMTYQWRLRMPSDTLWNLGVRYKLPSGNSRYDHSRAININNLFDLDYQRANRLLGERPAVYFAYSLNRSGGRR